VRREQPGVPERLQDEIASHLDGSVSGRFRAPAELANRYSAIGWLNNILTKEDASKIREDRNRGNSSRSGQTLGGAKFAPRPRLPAFSIHFLAQV
jgi:hypothetical protein